MKPLLFVVALNLSAAPQAAGAEGAAPPLQLKPKAAIVNAAPHKDAPFVLPAAAVPEVHFAPPRREERHESASSCNSDRALCYDPISDRIVYKPARNLLPEIPGLQRENISLKRDRIVFRYSF